MLLTEKKSDASLKMILTSNSQDPAEKSEEKEKENGFIIGIRRGEQFCNLGFVGALVYRNGSRDESLGSPGAKSEVVKVSRNKDKSVSKGSNVCSKEEFDSMLDKAEDKAKELASDILAGSIDVNPYYEKKEDYACQYCALKGICGFDPKIKGYEYRKLGQEAPEEDEE